MGLFGNRTPTLDLDPHLAADLPAVARARTGDFADLANLMSGLRAQGRWEHRELLIDHAIPRRAADLSWVDAWRAQAPDDADAGALHAAALVNSAWLVRTTDRARDVSRSQFDLFHEMLREATTALHDNLERHPGDPAAWTPVLAHARGLEVDATEFRALMEEAEIAVPTGFAWRQSVTDTLSAFWFGDFAVSSDYAIGAALSHPGTRLSLLPLFAAVRQQWHTTMPAAQRLLTQALPQARAYLGRGDLDDVERIEAGSLVAAWLVAIGQDRAARDVLRSHLTTRGVTSVDTATWGRYFNQAPEQTVTAVLSTR